MRSALVLALVLLPLAAASPAHPEPHAYVGAAGASLDGAPVAAPTAACPSVKALDDPTVGVGGACFPFVTQAGDDTGRTLTVYVTDAVFAPVHWVACVDVDANGLCGDAGDEVNHCWNGPTGAGSVSHLDGGPCDVYANPAALLSPVVHVILLAEASVTPNGPAPRAPSAGTILLL